MKQIRIHLDLSRGSGFWGRLAGLLLSIGLTVCLVLLLFGVWLAIGAIILIVMTAVVLREMFPGRRPTDRT
jgi:heme/copper-type cytochrome/quinol oxidase subunit 4